MKYVGITDNIKYHLKLKRKKKVKILWSIGKKIKEENNNETVQNIQKISRSSIFSYHSYKNFLNEKL